MEGDVVSPESQTYVGVVGGVVAQDPTHERDRSQVDQAMSRLDDSIGVVNEMIAKIGQRLEPVLRPGGTSAAVGEVVAREAIAAPLADAINNQAERVEDVSGHLRDLLNRLEV